MRSIEQIVDENYPINTLEKYFQRKYIITSAKLKFKKLKNYELYFPTESIDFLMGELSGFTESLQAIIDLKCYPDSEFAWLQEEEYFQKLDKKANLMNLESLMDSIQSYDLNDVFYGS